MDIEFDKGVVVQVDVDQQTNEWVLNTLEEVQAIAEKRGLVGEASGTVSVAETTTIESVPTPETIPEAPVISSEGLLATLDTALTTYYSQLDTTNSARAEVKSRKKDKPSPIESIDHDIIRVDVESIVANPDFIAELQKEVDYFTANPETDSPAAGFDILVIPEGLTSADAEAIAKDVQAEITKQYNPYIRPESYNDKRTPEVTGKGYRVVFAPRHYNIPSGNTDIQTAWKNSANKNTTASQLETATDVEALAQINNLLATPGELDDPNTRFHKTYFRRFDQTPPFDGCVSVVVVNGDGELFLGESLVRRDRSTRALVVPVQKLNA